VLWRRRDVASVWAFAERLHTLAARPFLIDGAEHENGVTIGIAVGPQDGVDLAVLLQRAEAAVSGSRRDGAPIACFDPSRHQPDEVNVREALELHQLEVHYQPQFDVDGGGMMGVEALVRWRHPVKGLIFPDAFLPHVEHAGLMAELTVEVLDQAARDHRAWRLEGRELHLSVNLAPSALLKDDLVEQVRSVIIRHGLPPNLLTLEITENVLLVDVERSMRMLHELRELGTELSLDDYGTGYCSLTYLRDLPLHEVKIDRSFVMELVPDSTDAAIVASTVALAKALGLRTVAEGVENDLALGMLRELGCDVVQGYLLGRPVPAGQLSAAVVPRPRTPAEKARLS
jgi:EAL domain-containing protein (putative c-di-GMP-specific phosphodiesterase class I)